MMPPGTYYIGDLYNVLQDKWEELCEITLDGLQVLDGEFTLSDGKQFAIYSTFYPSGKYYIDPINQPIVIEKTGAIGCILVNHINKINTNNGVIITFPKSFVTKNSDGLITFGDYMINTRVA